MAPGPPRAGVVQKARTDILPNRVRTVEPGGVRLLDLDGPGAAAAAHHQNMLRNLAQPRPDSAEPGPGELASAWVVVQQRLAVFRRQILVESRSARGWDLPADGSGHLFHLLGCRHAPAGGTVGHEQVEHIMNTRVESAEGRKSTNDPPGEGLGCRNQSPPFVLSRTALIFRSLRHGPRANWKGLLRLSLVT